MVPVSLIQVLAVDYSVGSQKSRKFNVPLSG